MTIETPYFGLEAFVLGDIYRGVVDQRRFTAIDMHMAFISDLVGNGIIQGWNLSSPSPLFLKVSSGWGLIDRFVTRTFGYYQKNLLDNSVVYAWMRLRPGVLGQISAFSNSVKIDYEDSSVPAAPSGFVVASQSENSLKITWNQSSEINFDIYKVYKSVDGSYFSLELETSAAEYVDTGLSQNTTYYYKVIAVNKSGTKSVFSSVFSASTLKDFSEPSNPGSVVIYSSNKSIHINWNASLSKIIDFYKIEVTPVTVENVPYDVSSSYIVDSSEVNFTLTGLDNDNKYLILIKSVSINGVESSGVVRYGIPRDNGGPIDVSSITVTDYAVNSAVSTNGINITWASSEDSYDAVFDGASEIRIEEYQNNGNVIVSNWIPNIEGISTRSIEIFSYLQNNQNVFKSISARSVYYITVRNVDSNGIASVGKRIRHYTKNFQNPEPITSLSILDRANKSLTAKWTNSKSIFSKNIITVAMRDVSTSEEVVIIDKQDIGTSTFFVLDESYSQSNKRYIFSIYCIDEFDNKSESISAYFDVLQNEIERPVAPSQQVGFAGDKQNTISWNKPLSDIVNGFRIYRADDDASLEPEDFALLETVSKDVFSFTDYDVQNNFTYVYFVTSVDIYGNESLNPRDSSYIEYPLITLTPQSNTTLLSPLDLTGVRVSNSVQIVWQPSGGQFDGYEVYRSIGNKYSYSLIATVSPSITSYLDSNVLSKTASYYYIVRKFRNEADLFVTENEGKVSGSVYLGKITTIDGVTSIDTSGSRNISRIEDPVREEALQRINDHKHSWISDADDRRINLGDTILVEDWESDDYQVYVTSVDISDTTVYKVYINNIDISNSNILYSLNKEEGTITFEYALASNGFDTSQNKTYLYEEPPKISVLFSNLQETQNTLPKERLENLSASQVSDGFVERRQMPSISHDGRRKEKLIPIQINTKSIDDGYRYIPVVSSEKFGDAVVFYDIYQSVNNDDVLVSSTSDGIYVSKDFGVSWNKSFSPITPINKFFYSKKYDCYFGCSNRGILFGRNENTNGFNEWSEVRGTENSKIVRDITESPSGVVICTTDIGVFKLQRDIGQGSFFFEQTPIFGPQSTESYAVFYDSYRSRFIVSNELGIFETNNNGIRWNYSYEFSEQRPIWSFANLGDTIFAITDYMIWRRSASDLEFKRVGVFDNANIARKISIWNNRIYVSTDSGLLVSSQLDDISSSENIKFIDAFSQLKTKMFSLPATSLNVISNKMFIGSECKVFISERPGTMSLHAEFSSSVIPTVYINEEQQYIGYRFTTNNATGGKFICFDEKRKIGDIVTVANQYKKFKAPSGGWADTNFIASVSVFVDGIKINDLSLSERPAQSISQIQLPSYNDRNANKFTADIAKSDFITKANNLVKTDNDSSGQPIALPNFVKDNVTSMLYASERFLSQIYDSAKVTPKIDSNGEQAVDDKGNLLYDPFVLPKFRVLLLTSPSVFSTTKISNYGVYSTWTKSTSNTQSSIIGNFGSELTSDGRLNAKYIGGEGDKGVKGG